MAGKKTGPDTSFRFYGPNPAVFFYSEIFQKYPDFDWKGSMY